MTPDERADAQPLTTQEVDLARDSMLGDRFMIRFTEDTLKHRPLGIRLIVEFIGTFILVTVAAGSGVINHYVGDGPISRTAAVIAPGAVVMAMIYALGPALGPAHQPRGHARLHGAPRVQGRLGRCPTSPCSSPAPSAPPSSSRPCTATWPRAATTRSPSRAGSGARS